jgi:hypothetical protein
MEADQSTVQSELASASGVEVNNKCRPGDVVGGPQRCTVVDEAEVVWAAALGRYICNTRQAPGVEVQCERVDGSSVGPVCCINGRRVFRRIGEPRGACSRHQLGDKGEGWWRCRKLKGGN